MKKYSFTPQIIGCAIIVLAMTVLTACDDFLDEQPRGNAIADTTDDYNAMFNATQFMNIAVPDYTKWLNPDITHTTTTLQNLDTQAIYGMMGGATTYGFSSTNAYQLMTNPYADTENCDIWAGFYQRIYTYNVIANGVMGSRAGTDAQRRALLAEARFSRAWMHFMLAQIFSKPYQLASDDDLTIPIVSQANSMEKSFTRATKKQLYDFIESDLTESVEDLEDRPDHKMRVYKTTGYAMLGKYYWMTGQYEKALDPLRKAYDRLKNETDFHLINFNDYDVPNNPNVDLSNSNIHPNLINSPELLWVKQNSGFLGAFMLGSYGPAYYISWDLYNLYDENDIRRNYVPTGAYVMSINWDTFEIVYVEQKYDGPVGCIRGNQDNYGVELADVYLGLAECEARVGNQANARNILREFRSNRLATGHEEVPADVVSQNDLIVFCVDEQRREYVDHLNGYYNLRRLWNDPLFQNRKPYTRTDGERTYTFTEDNLYLRLPEGVLKWNEEWRALITD